MRQTLSGDREALTSSGFPALQFQRPLPRLLLPKEGSLPARPQELIQLVCVQPIDCGDAILLASDLFCVEVTTFQNPICCFESFVER